MSDQARREAMAAEQKSAEVAALQRERAQLVGHNRQNRVDAIDVRLAELGVSNDAPVAAKKPPREKRSQP